MQFVLRSLAAYPIKKRAHNRHDNAEYDAPAQPAYIKSWHKLRNSKDDDAINDKSKKPECQNSDRER